MEQREATIANLSLRAGLLIGTINMARDVGFSVEEIARFTRLSTTEVMRLSGSALHDFLHPQEELYSWHGLEGLSASDVTRLEELGEVYGEAKVAQWVANGWDYAGSDNPTPPKEES